MKGLEERDRSIMAGLAKGLAVIEAFGSDRPRLTIAEAARHAGMERATARRCLLTLVRLGYAAHDGKYFTLQPRVTRLGHAYLTSTPLAAIVQPFLEHLSAEVSENVSASILDGTEIVYVARAVHNRLLSINIAVGTRLPTYCASMGRVMLAALPPEAMRELLVHSDRRRLTNRTLTSVADIVAEVDRARHRGYAIVDEEFEMGLRSVSVPIIGKSGVVRAALNVAAQAARLSVADIERDVLPRMRVVQAELRPLLP